MPNAVIFKRGINNKMKKKISLNSDFQIIFKCYDDIRRRQALAQSISHSSSSTMFGLRQKRQVEINYPHLGGIADALDECNDSYILAMNTLFAYSYHSLYYWIVEKYNASSDVQHADHFAMILITHLCEEGNKKLLEGNMASATFYQRRMETFIQELLQQDLLKDQEIREVLNTVLKRFSEEDAQLQSKPLWVADSLLPKIHQLNRCLNEKNIDRSLAPFSLETYINNIAMITALDTNSLSEREYRQLLLVIDRYLIGLVVYNDWLETAISSQKNTDIKSHVSAISKELNCLFRNISMFKCTHRQTLDNHYSLDCDAQFSQTIQPIVEAQASLLAKLRQEEQDNFVLIDRKDEALLGDNQHLRSLLVESEEKKELLSKHGDFVLQIMKANCLNQQALQVLSSWLTMRESDTLDIMRTRCVQIETLVKTVQQIDATLQLGKTMKDAYSQNAARHDKSLFFSHNHNGRRHAEGVINQWQASVTTITSDYITQVNESRSDVLEAFNADALSSKIKSTVKNLIINEKYSSYKQHSFRNYLYCFYDKVHSNDIECDNFFEKVACRSLTKRDMQSAEKSLLTAVDNSSFTANVSR